MINALNTTWSIGTALGELVSSMLFTWLLMTIIFFQKNVWEKKEGYGVLLVPALWSISALFSILCGIAVADLIRPGTGVGFLNPMFAIACATRLWEFKGLFYIIGSELVGCIFGLILYNAMIYIYNHHEGTSYKFRNELLLEERPYKTIAIKHTFAYTFVAVIFVLIPTLVVVDTNAPAATNASLMLNLLFMSIFMMLPFTFTSKWLTFYLLLPVGFYSLLVATCFKTIKKQNIINYTNCVLINIATTSTIGLLAFALHSAS